MNSLVFIFGLLLLTSSNALTPSPTAITGSSPGSVPTPAPTLDGSNNVPTPHPTSIDGSILTPVPTSSNGVSPSVGPTKSPINGILSRCIETDESLDIIFMVDSSGSVYDDNYKNWENELNLVYDIIDNAIPVNSRVGLINYSGCGESYTFEQCQEQNRLKTMISLNDNGSPINDLDAVLSTVEAIGEDDFNGGYTWTNDALTIALGEFNENINADSNKIIILISDGAPYPIDHAACKASTGDVSDTLKSLRLLDVDIVTIGIDIEQDIKEEYFNCITDGNADFHFDVTFGSNSIPSLVPTQNGLDVPSYKATPSPVTNGSPSPKPTPSPTAVSSPGTVPTPAPVSPTSDGNSSPSKLPTPSPVSPTLDGSNGVPSEQPTNGNGSPSPTAITGSSPGTVPTPAPTNGNGTPSNLPTPSPVSPTMDGSPSPKPTPSPTAGSSPGSVATPVPTNGNGSPSELPTPSPVSPTSDSSNGVSPSPTMNGSNGSPSKLPTPSPVSPTIDASNGTPSELPTPSPVSPTSGSSNGSPSDLPTPSPVSPTMDGSNGVPSEQPTTVNGTPSKLPTPSPVSPTMAGSNGSPSPTSMTSPGTVSTPVPTSDVSNGSPSPKPTPSPTVSGQAGPVPTPPPTLDGSASSPTSMLAPGSVPTPVPTSGESNGVSPTSNAGIVPTPHPTSIDGSILTPVPTISSAIAIEDISDLIGDFLCAELGSTRLIIPTDPSLVPTPSPVTGGQVPSNALMAGIYTNLIIISALIGYLLF